MKFLFGNIWIHSNLFGIVQTFKEIEQNHKSVGNERRPITFRECALTPPWGWRWGPRRGGQLGTGRPCDWYSTPEALLRRRSEWRALPFRLQRLLLAVGSVTGLGRRMATPKANALRLPHCRRRRFCFVGVSVLRGSKSSKRKKAEGGIGPAHGCSAQRSAWAEEGRGPREGLRGAGAGPAWGSRGGRAPGDCAGEPGND